MKKLAFVFTLTGLCFLMFPFSAGACSCAWRGPFLVVAKDAPLIIHGRILRHQFGQPPTMSVLVLETLKGGLLDSGLVVQMGDGMHCRPALEGFPPGSEWILALNGPGSKPGDGLALSHCGEYWLRVEKGEVIGSIDGTLSQVKKIPLDALRRKIRYPRFDTTFEGRVSQGERFQRPFGENFVFVLEPMPGGWEIVIKEHGRDENLARLTPPFHFVPNPRYIEGWHLSEDPSACPTREYLADAGPANPREVIFSPEVGKSIDGPKSRRAVEAQEVEEIERFGRGELTIKEFKLQPTADGCPMIEWMQFSVRVQGGY
ncbi:MAG: hypothetical protein ABIN58_05780 [candidate division WOR-3 bacterium]